MCLILLKNKPLWFFLKCDPEHLEWSQWLKERRLLDLPHVKKQKFLFDLPGFFIFPLETTGQMSAGNRIFVCSNNRNMVYFEIISYITSTTNAQAGPSFSLVPFGASHFRPLFNWFHFLLILLLQISLHAQNKHLCLVKTKKDIFKCWVRQKHVRQNVKKVWEKNVDDYNKIWRALTQDPAGFNKSRNKED